MWLGISFPINKMEGLYNMISEIPSGSIKNLRSQNSKKNNFATQEKLRNES